MTTTDAKPLADDQAQTWAKLVAIREKIRELKADEATYAGQLRESCGRGVFADPAGGPPLSIAPTRRFNPELAMAVLQTQRPDLLPKVVKLVVDRELAEKVLVNDLAPLYEACQKESDKDTVSIVKGRPW